MINKTTDHTENPVGAALSSVNTLYPIFLKLENFSLLIAGGGSVAEEKLKSISLNSPHANIRLVAPQILPSVLELINSNERITYFEREAQENDFDGVSFVIVATGNKDDNIQLHGIAKSRAIPVNVADTPELCDFYLGSIVRKGDLKIAISTNGKSPTIAKRLREIFSESIPGEMDELLTNMKVIRERLNGDFSAKVKRLNELTRTLAINEDQDISKPLHVRAAELKWKRIASISIIAFACMIIGYFVLDYFGFPDFVTVRNLVVEGVDSQFLLIVLSGFLAQMADGMLSLGYGAINSMVLLSMGLPPATISGSIHTAEIFSTGFSGYSHYKFGNVNKKLFRTLLVPGILGAVAGAIILIWVGETNAKWIKPILAAYCALLGARILFSAFKKERRKSKVKRVGWLAGAGGFLDSFGGGGWGPLVTSTLVSKGKTPRYVIGSVSLCEFFVTLASAFSFFIFLGITHLSIIVALIIGGMLAAPIAAKLTGKIPTKPMLIIVGAMVILWSVKIIVSLIN